MLEIAFASLRSKSKELLQEQWMGRLPSLSWVLHLLVFLWNELQGEFLQPCTHLLVLLW